MARAHGRPLWSFPHLPLYCACGSSVGLHGSRRLLGEGRSAGLHAAAVHGQDAHAAPGQRRAAHRAPHRLALAQHRQRARGRHAHARLHDAQLRARRRRLRHSFHPGHNRKQRQPSTASARVAATRTRACTTPSRARAADASGAAASRFHLGLLSSGSAPERSARVCAALSHPHQRPPRATIDSRASPGQPARCSGRPREGHIYSHPDALTALQQGRACLSRRLQRMRALSVTPSQPP